MSAMESGVEECGCYFSMIGRFCFEMGRDACVVMAQYGGDPVSNVASFWYWAGPGANCEHATDRLSAHLPDFTGRN